MAALRAIQPTRRRMVLTVEGKSQAIGIDQAGIQIPALGELSLLRFPPDRARLFGSFVDQARPLGVLLLIDGNDAAAIEELRYYLKQLTNSDQKPPLAIGVTHLDRAATKRLDKLALQIADFGLRCPLFRVDAREHGDVTLLLEALLLTLHAARGEERIDQFAAMSEPQSSGFCS